MYDPRKILPLPKIINLLTDLKEDRDVLIHDGWVTYPMMKIRSDFEVSLKKYPPIKKWVRQIRHEAKSRTSANS
jgi:arylsulfatase